MFIDQFNRGVIIIELGLKLKTILLTIFVVVVVVLDVVVGGGVVVVVVVDVVVVKFKLNFLFLVRMN